MLCLVLPSKSPRPAIHCSFLCLFFTIALPFPSQFLNDGCSQFLVFAILLLHPPHNILRKQHPSPFIHLSRPLPEIPSPPLSFSSSTQPVLTIPLPIASPLHRLSGERLLPSQQSSPESPLALSRHIKQSGCAASTQPDVPSPGKIEGNDQLRETILTRDNSAEEANIQSEMLGQPLLRKQLYSYPMHNLPLLLLPSPCKVELLILFRHHPMDVTVASVWKRRREEKR
ncbi:uncharacterized protein MONOS_15157 [Monocercomonoides exilis]|uniref:uncharacterized protein n=1 Tax=Monocercomonoides exilis TaxID=2049356 RepID=UPI00355AAFB5|nr:hypothetical protein MONOS_15157 [Monocercomonoides exilis]|eukprot:MONOS_15157.1-p1 / transcript=MONOS_15157.1 / gene=MONOS_15157 / organism=Monocercomonoides_exilis_PA203 / gene_product=unspecified product / transcript_product=unspecified product / location=Mono_scaffold01158:4832-5515(-) / protein_length=228 / sequence_SO=supercontig / SO=protein_coding / is_pseudo=false